MIRSSLTPKLLAWSLAVAGAFVDLACARVEPASSHSPSAPSSEAGAPADVERALVEAPPLPGTDPGGWTGLATALDAAHEAHRHGGHDGR